MRGVNVEKLEGVIERITFINEENSFCVLKMRSKGYRELITITGNMTHLHIGTVVSVEGNWSVNQNFGKQFNVTKFEERLPADIYGIQKYLASGCIKGIGPKYAKLIVETFGTQTLEIIENQPHRLIEVSKLGQKRVNLITKAWVEQKDIKNLMIFLQGIGVTTALGHKIFKVYRSESITKIKENPYNLIDDIEGVGFVTADAIADKLGVDKESYARCRAGIFYILSHLANTEGHCYVPKEEVVKKCVKMLGIEDCKTVMTYDFHSKNGELFLEDNEKMYLPAFYHSEVGLARRITNIINYPMFEKFDENEIENSIKILQNINKIKYDDLQISAIKTVLNSRFSVITGGAGVGKTTIVKAIISILKNHGKKILLTAPTGRAAKIMAEICGLEAKTIHRLLEAKPKEGFSKCKENPLNGDVMIVDEASMIDVILMYNLMKAVPNHMTVVLIGDSNQLASVSAGNVLKDVIDSGVVPVIKLEKIYRQEGTSNIILNSHKINCGEMPDLTQKIDSDFFFFERENSTEIANLICDLYSKKLPNHYNINPISDIQVLAPTKKGELGTENLNKMLQSVLNKNTLCLRRGANEYRIYDKVMQMKNNYDKDIFNGDIGTISSINLDDKTLTVNFEGKNMKYEAQELEELSLSYACTVHKSQGCEFEIIIMPVTFKHYIMLRRNLLYTAVTRAKKAVILIGEKRAIEHAVNNNDSQKRNTLLAKKLRNYKQSLF